LAGRSARDDHGSISCYVGLGCSHFTADFPGCCLIGVSLLDGRVAAHCQRTPWPLTTV
jgi:hypothetical protein